MASFTCLLLDYLYSIGAYKYIMYTQNVYGNSIIYLIRALFRFSTSY